MPYEEKSAWAFLTVAIAGYATYAVIVLSRASGTGLAATDYAPVMLWTIGAGIVAGIVGNIVVSIGSPLPRDRTDQRDREIKAFGDRVGQAFLVLGGVGALLLSLLHADYFWIANVIYLAFVLSAILGSVARLVAYRKGLPTW